MTETFKASQADNAVHIIGKSVLYENGNMYKFGGLESIAFGDDSPFVIRTTNGDVRRSNVIITIIN